VSLYLGSVAIAHHEGIDTLFTFTEIRLVEHFQRLGVPIRSIHPPVSHKGVRLPCMLDVAETVGCFQPYVRGLYDEIVSQMNRQYSGGMSDGLEIKTGKSTT
jgi:N-acyl-L-homoserine lactone synthetase